MSDLCSELTDLITLQLTWRHLNPLNRVVRGMLSLHPLGGSVPSSAIVIVPQKSHCSDWILPILTVQIHNYKWLVCSCNYVLWNSTHAHVDASLHESQPRTKKNMFLRQSVAFKTQKTVSFVANAWMEFCSGGQRSSMSAVCDARCQLSQLSSFRSAYRQTLWFGRAANAGRWRQRSARARHRQNATWIPICPF